MTGTIPIRYAVRKGGKVIKKQQSPKKIFVFRDEKTELDFLKTFLK